MVAMIATEVKGGVHHHFGSAQSFPWLLSLFFLSFSPVSCCSALLPSTMAALPYQFGAISKADADGEPSLRRSV